MTKTKFNKITDFFNVKTIVKIQALQAILLL